MIVVHLIEVPDEKYCSGRKLPEYIHIAECIHINAGDGRPRCRVGFTPVITDEGIMKPDECLGLLDAKTVAKRHMVQPNPGWGHLCFRCKEQLRPADDDFPCRRVHLAATELKPSPDITRYGRAGNCFQDSIESRDFVEICVAFVSADKAS